MVELERVPHSTDINLAPWGYFSRGGREEGRELSKLIRSEFDETPPRAYLPTIYAPRCDGIGGSAVSDPLTVYFQIPLGPNSDEHPTYHISMTQLVEDIIDDDWGGGEGAARVVQALHELLDHARKRLEQTRPVQADVNRKD